MIDFHNHLLPAVDDGAANLEETRAALRAMHEQGVRTVVVTPHLNAVITERPAQLTGALAQLDTAFAQVQELVAAEFPDLRVERGVELMLDSPTADLSDARVRLGGTQFLLVEFPGLMAPPHSVQALYELKIRGWRPIVAHPERYRNMDDLELVDEWRTVGCYIQVNTGSVIGRYGERAAKTVAELMRRGWIDYLCSDYHARGRLTVQECRERLLRNGGELQVRLMMEENPRRMLENQEPEPVPGFDPDQPFWRRLLRLK